MNTLSKVLGAIGLVVAVAGIAIAGAASVNFVNQRVVIPLPGLTFGAPLSMPVLGKANVAQSATNCLTADGARADIPLLTATRELIRDGKITKLSVQESADMIYRPGDEIIDTISYANPFPISMREAVINGKYGYDLSFQSYEFSSSEAKDWKVETPPTDGSPGTYKFTYTGHDGKGLSRYQQVTVRLHFKVNIGVPRLGAAYHWVDSGIIDTGSMYFRELGKR